MFFRTFPPHVLATLQGSDITASSRNPISLNFKMFCYSALIAEDLVCLKQPNILPSCHWNRPWMTEEAYIEVMALSLHETILYHSPESKPSRIEARQRHSS
jgi:hypothetical protein